MDRKRQIFGFLEVTKHDQYALDCDNIASYTENTFRIESQRCVFVDWLTYPVDWQ